VSRGYGFTLVELFIGLAIAAVLAVGLGAYIFHCDVLGGDPADTGVADRDVLPGKVNIVCIEGHEYYYVQSRFEHYARAGLAPKFDDEGRPVKCRAEQ
jgi:prepilin-type N-terminal cleavage/methylation domain-containing protein